MTRFPEPKKNIGAEPQRPTQDNDLKERLVKMCDNISKINDWTPSEKVAHAGRVRAVEMILDEIERRGYRLDRK